MIHILYSIFNINLQMLNSFFCYEIIYFRRECQIHIFSKVKIFFQNNGTNKNSIIKRFNKYKVCERKY